MTVKVCSEHCKEKRRKRIRRCCAGLLIVLFIILFIILITWAILQPRKPRFVLEDATVFSLNVTSPYALSSSFQFTIVSRNLNNKIGIYYDSLHAYAVYRSQQITYETAIPPTYQGHKDVNVWSPFVYGTMVPVAPYNGDALSQDQASGSISLLIKLDGNVRWKVGTMITARYNLHIKCPAYIPFGSQKSAGETAGSSIKYQLSQSCSVSTVRS